MLLITSKKSRPAGFLLQHKYGDTVPVNRF
jgi:hypothetical protein